MKVVEYDGGLVLGAHQAVSGHPALGDGVVVQNQGWGLSAFWVPPADDYLGMYVQGVPTDGLVDQTEVQAQARLFDLADAFLQELGWSG